MVKVARRQLRRALNRARWSPAILPNLNRKINTICTFAPYAEHNLSRRFLNAIKPFPVGRNAAKKTANNCLLILIKNKDAP
jgi:hypothetical protein